LFPAIGDFKKRNFTVEIAAHKLVRLVFNGHLLQPESKTLKNCGLFDNCVVHCLIHNQKNTQQQLNRDGGVETSNNSAQDNGKK
jgi:transmembrane and ubiquitin-like domain-containing protein